MSLQGPAGGSCCPLCLGEKEKGRQQVARAHGSLRAHLDRNPEPGILQLTSAGRTPPSMPGPGGWRGHRHQKRPLRAPPDPPSAPHFQDSPPALGQRAPPKSGAASSTDPAPPARPPPGLGDPRGYGGVTSVPALVPRPSGAPQPRARPARAAKPGQQNSGTTSEHFFFTPTRPTAGTAGDTGRRGEGRGEEERKAKKPHE